MITFITSPKPFLGSATILQTRALRSWRASCPESEVLVYGGRREDFDVIESLGAVPVTDPIPSVDEPPDFRSIAEYASKHGKYDVQVYINCDILLTSDFGETMDRCFRSLGTFLAVGERWDLAPDTVVEVGDLVRFDLCEVLDRRLVSLHGPYGSDYFGFTRGLFDDGPPVMVGRAGYDNALIAHALRKRARVIDLTLAVRALHQFHDYDHVSGGKASVFAGDGAIRNFELIGSPIRPVCSDADLTFDGEKFARNYGRGDWVRHLELRARLGCRFRFLGSAFSLLGRIARQAHLSRRACLDPTDVAAHLTERLKGLSKGELS